MTLREKQINVVYRAKELIEQHERDEVNPRFQVLANARRSCYRIMEETRR